MGFGSMLENAKSVVKESMGEGARMPNVFLDVREGKRTFRFIPDPKNPGEPLQGEIVLSVWMPVMKDGKLVERRVFIDEAGRKLLNEADKAAGREGDTAWAGKIKRRFFLNVYDRTRVIKLPDGTIVYPNLKNEYWQKNSDGKLSQIAGQSEPNNTVMVLEGSVSLRADRRGGLLNDLDDLSKMIYDDSGTKLVPITQVDIEMVTKGTGLATTRTVHPGMNREKFPVDSATLPVYDLKNFTKAWPIDAIGALIHGSEYGEVVKNFNLLMVPQATVASAEDLF
jgi:hypothetical protein